MPLHGASLASWCLLVFVHCYRSSGQHTPRAVARQDKMLRIAWKSYQSDIPGVVRSGCHSPIAEVLA
jgi:hypothetical protein